MKYLKRYESWPDYIIFYGLKKYLICKNKEDNTYLTLELIRSTENFYIIVQTLTFSKKTDKISKSAEISIKINTILDRIVFQSDDINEIKNELQLLKNTDKYGI